LPEADQGHTYPDFPEAADGVAGQLGVDSKKALIFVNLATHVAIVADDSPPVVVGSSADPDVNTTAAVETPGRTGANVAGSAQGYGARMRAVGGIDALFDNATGNTIEGCTASVPYPPDPPPPPPAPAGLANPCGSREEKYAVLDRLSVANGEATAEVTAGERDTRTQANETATSPDREEVWPYEPLGCSDTGGTPTTSSRRDSSSEVAVDCDARVPRAVGAAAMGPSGANTVSVERSSVRASAIREPDAGMHVRVEASADGVVVAAADGVELLRIGSVVHTVDAVAHGRPGSAHSTTQTAIRRAYIRGAEQCDPCDPANLEKEVNSKLAGILRISFPQPDPELAAGSPGGFQALVRRKASEHSEDKALNEQPEDRLEVPGMVMTLFADNYVPWRTMVELAGVEAEARYGIYVIDGTSDPNTELNSGNVLTGEGQPAMTLLGGLLPTEPLLGSGGGVNLSQAPVGRSRSPLDQLLRILRNPLRLLFGGDPAAMGVVWTLLLLPIYLSARRWLLLRRATLFEDVA
jgi:hypothetical protein